MRKKVKTPIVEQLDLFVPPPQRPTWRQLPPAVRRRLIELLAELLRGKGKPKASRAKAKEAVDE
jgi:hypothetical protein